MALIQKCSVCEKTICDSSLCFDCKTKIAFNTLAGKPFNKEEIAQEVKDERYKKEQEEREEKLQMLYEQRSLEEFKKENKELKNEIKKLKSGTKETNNNTIVMIPEDEIKIIKNRNIQLETENKNLKSRINELENNNREIIKTMLGDTSR